MFIDPELRYGNRDADKDRRPSYSGQKASLAENIFGVFVIIVFIVVTCGVCAWLGS
jgi:hypothetical protein